VFVIEVPTSVPESILRADEIDASLHDPATLARELQRIRHAMGIDADDPPNDALELVVGTSASQCILERARAHRAELIVAGMRHHGLLGRMVGNDTVGHLVAASAFPVLAVQCTLESRPRSIVVGVDFTRASLRAVHLARRIVAGGGTIRLLHVRADESEARLERDRAEELLAARGAEALFDALLRDLHPSGDVSIVSAIVSGDPVTSLLGFAARAEADLLAVGSQRYRLRDRARIGSVADALRHRAPCSMLLVPPPETGATPY
jgi:nucleotide-binding universal stress UspA family protein